MGQVDMPTDSSKEIPWQHTLDIRESLQKKLDHLTFRTTLVAQVTTRSPGCFIATTTIHVVL